VTTGDFFLHFQETKASIQNNQMALPLAYFIISDSPLTAALMPPFYKTTHLIVLSASALYSLSPHTETTWLHLSPHYVNHFFLYQSKL
jgi:hypothetical protein